MNKPERRRWEPDDPRNDRVYMGILMVLMATVAIGAVAAIAGELVFASEALTDVGFAAAVLAGAAYFAFRLWGRARAWRHHQDKHRRGPAGDGDEAAGGPDAGRDDERGR